MVVTTSKQPCGVYTHGCGNLDFSVWGTRLKCLNTAIGVLISGVLKNVLLMEVSNSGCPYVEIFH